MDLNINTIIKLAPIATSVATSIGVLVALGSLWVQGKRSRFAQSIDLLLKLEERFFDKDAMIEARIRAATALKNHRKKVVNPPSKMDDVDDVLDFFEHVGLLERRKAIDEEMVWHSFYYHLQSYYLLSKQHIQEKMEKSPVIWEDMVKLQKKLVDIEWERNKTRYDIDLAPERLDEFLEDECALGKKPPASSPKG